MISAAFFCRRSLHHFIRQESIKKEDSHSLNLNTVVAKPIRQYAGKVSCLRISTSEGITFAVKTLPVLSHVHSILLFQEKLVYSALPKSNDHIILGRHVSAAAQNDAPPKGGAVRSYAIGPVYHSFGQRSPSRCRGRCNCQYPSSAFADELSAH